MQENRMSAGSGNSDSARVETDEKLRATMVEMKTVAPGPSYP